MYKRRGYAYAVEWEYRKKCGVFGRNWYSLDYKLDEFIPFTNAFEARAAQTESLKRPRDIGGGLVRSFIFEFELAIAQNTKEELEIERLGSLVVFAKPRFGRRHDWWKVLGGGKDFLITFKPYARAAGALRTLEKMRRSGHLACLASWKVRRVTRDSVPLIAAGR